MPEGDTIYRTAVTLNRWLTGRAITAATTTVAGLPATKLVGQTVESVEAKGKHLVIRFSAGVALHTHMKMTGAWHVYVRGAGWRKPRNQARLVLEAGERIAVCFNAPVIELLAAGVEPRFPALVDLGPDILKPPVDLEGVRDRMRAQPPSTPVGDVLLDQRVVAGIGNIWRCETLFACRVAPRRPISELSDADVDRLITTAAKLMGPGAFTDNRVPAKVYRRTRRPCVRCRTPIRAERFGRDARTVYWCPTCQPD